MKFNAYETINRNRESLPVRGAWIEIGFMAGKIAQNASLPVRGAWIEIG